VADVILVKKMLSGARLSRSESKILWNDIFDGVHTHSRIAAILGVLSSRVPNHDEFSAILDVMLERAIEVKLGDEPVLDVCGTGGDGKDTFNISTTTAFVVAGCGVRVAKHGNYGASSKCGSSDVLQALGVPLFPTVSSCASFACSY
jgi:anthranilate phosphoribosyltransferase